MYAIYAHEYGYDIYMNMNTYTNMDVNKDMD